MPSVAVNINLVPSFCYPIRLRNESCTSYTSGSHFSTPNVGRENLPCAVKFYGYHSLYETVPKPLREVSYVNKALGQQAVGMLIPYLENVCLSSNIFGGCVRRHQAI